MEHVLPLLEKAMRHYASDTALRFEDVAITYAALAGLVDDASAHLQGARVGPGDRVALLLGNSPDYLIFDIALMRLGAVKVPLNPMLSDPELVHIIEHSAPACVVTNDEMSGRIDLAVLGARSPRSMVTAGDGLYRKEPSGSEPFTAAPGGPGDPAVIYYTGGTTGKPKGVVHTNRSVACNLVAHVIEADLRRNERMLLMTPLSHSAGLFALSGLMMGASVTIHRSFAVPRLVKEVHDGGATWTFLVPTMIYRLLDEVAASGERLSGLETIVYGASPITPNRLRQALGSIDAGFIQLYGQTECPNFGTTLDKLEHERSVRTESLRESCGKASTMVDVRVMLDGRVAEPGEIGEVCLQAPYLMAGYLDDWEATEQALVDGWLHTGDVGVLDESGYLHLKDRKKDMIISGGMNVYPAEVEAVLQRLDGVSQVAVIGIPHETWGESVCAFVVRERGSTLGAQGVLSFARGQLGTYKRPKQVEFVEALPLTAVGKPDKKALRQAFLAASERQIQ